MDHKKAGQPRWIGVPGLGVLERGSPDVSGLLLLGLHHAAHAAVVMAVSAISFCLFRKIGDEGFGGEK
jgi:hypothetical protein